MNKITFTDDNKMIFNKLNGKVYNFHCENRKTKKCIASAKGVLIDNKLEVEWNHKHTNACKLVKKEKSNI